MPIEPAAKRAVAFFDGQNLYHGAKGLFAYQFPNFDVQALAHTVCHGNAWNLSQVRFYTGIPRRGDDVFWNNFWSNKLRAMRGQGISVFTRHLRKRGDSFVEKGIDVRIALDVVRMARHDDFDVALIFSQDQDFTEVAAEVRSIAQEKDRWIKIASAYPFQSGCANPRGILNTDWIKIDKATYDRCIDPTDYRGAP